MHLHSMTRSDYDFIAQKITISINTILFTRHAAMAERKVNMDQRRTENTLSTNRQSDLENQYKNDFRDGKRIDAAEVIESKLKNIRRAEQLPMDDQLKSYRLACFIFEVLILYCYENISELLTHYKPLFAG